MCDDKIINEIYKYHNDWLNVAYSILNNKEDAEDLVQDVYLKLILKLNNGTLKSIRYKDTINKYFVYRAVKNACIDFLRKKNKINIVEFHNNKIRDEINEDEEIKGQMFVKIVDELQNWDKKDAEIFELYMYSGLSMKSISYIYGVSKSSIFNYIKAGKQRIKDKFGEDMEDYFNNDYEFIT